MKSKKIALFSCAALVAAGIGLNIQNALADYGIGENSLSLVAGTGSNSGSNYNSNSSSDDWEDDMESNLGALSNSCSNSYGLTDIIFDPCIALFATMKSKPCKDSETHLDAGENHGGNVTIPIDGVPIEIGIEDGNHFNYSNTNYNGKTEHVCEHEFTTSYCDRRGQTDCNGKKIPCP